MFSNIYSFDTCVLSVVLILVLPKQLRKEGRRNEYERHKLEALHQRQKMVRNNIWQGSV